LSNHFVLVFVSAVLAQAQSKPATPPLTCPGTLKSYDTATTVTGWTSAGGQSDHAFDRVSIYNGTVTGEHSGLAPDYQKNSAGKIVQTWNLKDYRSMNIYLRCRYHDTSATIFRDVPASYTTCTFTLDKQGTFLGKSSLLCR